MGYRCESGKGTCERKTYQAPFLFPLTPHPVYPKASADQLRRMTDDLAEAQSDATAAGHQIRQLQEALKIEQQRTQRAEQMIAEAKAQVGARGEK